MLLSLHQGNIKITKIMKKIFINIILIVGTLFSTVSCEKDFINPTASIVTGSTLVAPAEGATFNLNPGASTATAMTVKWSSVDFGYLASVKYVLQIVKSTDNFNNPQLITLGTFNENTNSVHELAITTKEINLILYNLEAPLGVTSSFKMRVYAQPAGQLDTSENGVRSYSAETTFKSNVYDPIDELPRIYCYGNFGAASSFADWDINTNGTSNSPPLYSPAKDGKYSGFVFMNVASPLFKFANPTSTDLNIKGLGASAGTLLSSTDVSTGNVISAPAPLGDFTYFVTADWNSNTYTIIKRKLALRGTMTSNIPVYLTYIVDAASPYYRMYVATNVSLIANASGYIQLKDSSTLVDRMGIDNTNTVLQVSPNSSSRIKNKMKTGSSSFTVSTAGVYTVVLNLKNSGDYNLRVIPN